MDLKEITRPVQQQLDTFEGVFKESIRSKIGLVDLVARYIIRQKGKRVRPILVLLCADICGGVTDKTHRGATLVEILHTATLVHDDVIDEADTRRGIASINAVWKNKIAVLIGDYLIARGLLLSLENDDFRFLKITSMSVRRMSEGEIHQIQRSRKLDLDEESYLAIIGDKTASLISTCCEIGAASATDDREKAQLMREYGENVGLAFQIADDILDTTSTAEQLGKTVGKDAAAEKLTYPAVFGLEKSRAEADRLAADAVAALAEFGPAAGPLRELAEFVIARTS